MSNHDCSCSECESYRIEEGAYARRMGTPIALNPYKANQAYARQWEVGYMSEERALRLGFTD